MPPTFLQFVHMHFFSNFIFYLVDYTVDSRGGGSPKTIVNNKEDSKVVGNHKRFCQVLNPVTRGLWFIDATHRHLAILVLYLISSHMHRSKWDIEHIIKEVWDPRKCPFTIKGHKGLYEILPTCSHVRLFGVFPFKVIANKKYEKVRVSPCSTNEAYKLCKKCNSKKCPRLEN